MFKNWFRPKQTTQFKQFFRLTIEDKPVSLYSKIRYFWIMNPYFAKFKFVTKFVVAFGFLFWVREGSNLPG